MAGFPCVLVSGRLYANGCSLYNGSRGIFISYGRACYSSYWFLFVVGFCTSYLIMWRLSGIYAVSHFCHLRGFICFISFCVCVYVLCFISYSSKYFLLPNILLNSSHGWVNQFTGLTFVVLTSHRKPGKFMTCSTCKDGGLMTESCVLESEGEKKKPWDWVSLITHLVSISVWLCCSQLVIRYAEPSLEVWRGYLNASLHSTDLCEKLYAVVSFTHVGICKGLLTYPLWMLHVYGIC